MIPSNNKGNLYAHNGYNAFNIQQKGLTSCFKMSVNTQGWHFCLYIVFYPLSLFAELYCVNNVFSTLDRFWREKTPSVAINGKRWAETNTAYYFYTLILKSHTMHFNFIYTSSPPWAMAVFETSMDMAHVTCIGKRRYTWTEAHVVGDLEVS